MCVCVCMCMLSSLHSASQNACCNLCMRTSVGMIMCVVHAIKREYMYVSVISLHSPIDSYLCVYESVCMLTQLKD